MSEIKILLISVIVFLFLVYSYSNNISDSNFNRMNEDELWNSLIVTYLEDSLWCDEFKYDAAYDLMVLMHDAFQRDDKLRIEGFNNHFKSFLLNKNTFKGSNRTHDLQYMYFASQYLVLSAKSEIKNELLVELYDLLKKEIEDIWIKEKFRVSNTDIKKYFYYSGLEERLEWKINDTVYRKIAPYKAIIDIEHFTFAISADLNYVNKKYLLNKNYQLFEDVLSLAHKTFSKRITYINDTIWYHQIGYRDEKRDFYFAGYKDKYKVTEPKIIENIASDANHFQRMPLWLSSMMSGDETNRLYYEKLHNDLEIIFQNNIIVLPDENSPYIRVNNFIDGNNGVYRWNYSTLKKNEGYGPYELSYSLLHGWYAFIKKESVRDIFIMLNEEFPIPEESGYLYRDKTQRRQHAIIKNGLDNGLYWLISNAASRIN